MKWDDGNSFHPQGSSHSKAASQPDAAMPEEDYDNWEENYEYENNDESNTEYENRSQWTERPPSVHEEEPWENKADPGEDFNGSHRENHRVGSSHGGGSCVAKSAASGRRSHSSTAASDQHSRRNSTTAHSHRSHHNSATESDRRSQRSSTRPHGQRSRHALIAAHDQKSSRDGDERRFSHRSVAAVSDRTTFRSNDKGAHHVHHHPFGLILQNDNFKTRIILPRGRIKSVESKVAIRKEGKTEIEEQTVVIRLRKITRANR
ncbi:hypothetical protein VTN31DRAFT_51 [Thermomyces dupontii]|uniref:uncharacterized protein n=1 Tax=Talaromyces thermophilus TaxID=28565 RepID=UPI0037435117